MELVRSKRTQGRDGVYRSARRLNQLYAVLASLVILCFVFLIWLFPTRIAGQSMTPALEGGEVVLCSRLAKYWKAPTRGDMILFETADGLFIKRIVGLPGETIEIVGGHVFIDSTPLDESAYLLNATGDMPPRTIEHDRVFVLGDNREQVYDSRLESVGCIPYAGIRGVLRLRVYPITRFTIFS